MNISSGSGMQGNDRKAKARESNRRYIHTEKGKETRKKYIESEKGRVSVEKYRASENGKRAIRLNSKVTRMARQRVGGRLEYDNLPLQEKKSLRSSIRNEIHAEEAAETLSGASAEQLNSSFAEMANTQRDRFIASLPESSRNDLFSLNRKSVFSSLAKHFNGDEILNEERVEEFLKNIPPDDILELTQGLKTIESLNKIADYLTYEQSEVFFGMES